MSKITYKLSGVDVQAGNEFVRRIKSLAQKTSKAQVLSPIGGFGGLYELAGLGLKNPVLVASADGVGTKVKLAIEMKRYNTVGIDAVAMNVNDILTVGARPLFFLDYLAVGKLNINTGVKIIEGISKGCIIAGCSLIGGETAEMPSVYRKDNFDLAGFCVGAVDKDKIIDGEDISEGDMVIGLKSSGFHSNGFSLIRKVIKEKRLDLKKRYMGFKKTLGDLLIEPTKIYVSSVLDLKEKVKIKGMAHITGGSFKDKISRIIPEGLCAAINRNLWRLPNIFKFIQEQGKIDDSEMYKTFNCGIGFVLVVSSNEARKAFDHYGGEAIEIGYIEKNPAEKVKLI